MDSPPSLDEVCQAIYTLYHNGPAADTTGKEKASLYLSNLQRSVYAWKIADDLLLHKNDHVSCYFAAQTMKIKIQNSFHELPPDSHSSLRDSLLNHISQITQDTSPVIVTQLCLALALLTLQMATWKNPVDDLISRYGSNIQHVSTLLEILTLLPEEVSSKSLRLGANRRAEVLETLSQVSPRILQLLNSYMQSLGQTEPRIVIKVFRCLGSWFSIKALPTTDPAVSVLLSYCFQALSNHNTAPMVHDAAADALCNALMLIEDTSKHQVLAQVLFQGVYSLVEAYHVAVSQEDIDKVMNYCRVFTELAESLLNEILEFPNVAFGNLQTLDLLLICAGHHDYEVAEITFNFWYRLSELLYKKDNDSLNSVFEPYIQRLIIALCRHCQLEQDFEGVPDDNDDFAAFRIRVSDIIKDVVFVIGSSMCFQQMFDNLRNKGSCSTWDASEASLFVMGAVAKNIVPSESTIVPQVVEAILNLPDSTHIAVRYTSTYLLGELCEWIEKHPQYLDPVLNFILSCLQQPPLSSIAATAIRNICSTCKKQMASHFGGLLQILQAVDTLSLSNEAAEGLIKGTALILGQMPFDKITDGLRELCKTQLAPFSQVLKEDKSLVKEGTKNDPAVWLDRLAAIFRNVTPSVLNGQLHPCKPIAEEVWPLLSETCNQYQGDIRVIERCCRCLRFIVRCVGKQSASLLEPLVQQMVTLYQAHQHSCFLYLGSILVDEYGSEPGCVQGLLDMLQAFCGPTFRLLEKPNGLRDHPDTVDDLFRLCARFLQWSPVPFLQCSALKPIIQCAIMACNLDHRDANTSVMKFFHDLVSGTKTSDMSETYHQRRALVQSILAEHGQQLVNALLQASIFSLPSYMLINVANVLYELVVFNKESLCTWLELSLKSLPTVSSGGSVTATPEQLSEFHNTVISAQHMKSVSTALREFVRLYR